MTPDQICRLADEGEGLRREFKRHVDDMPGEAIVCPGGRRTAR